MAGPDTGRPAGAARPVDRHSPMPLWAQLRDDLRRRLEAGSFDGAFPGELALVAEYAVTGIPSGQRCVSCARKGSW